VNKKVDTELCLEIYEEYTGIKSSVYQKVLLILFPKHVTNGPYSYEICLIYVNFTATTANHSYLYTNF